MKLSGGQFSRAGRTFAPVLDGLRRNPGAVPAFRYGGISFS